MCLPRYEFDRDHDSEVESRSGIANRNEFWKKTAKHSVFSLVLGVIRVAHLLIPNV